MAESAGRRPVLRWLRVGAIGVLGGLVASYLGLTYLVTREEAEHSRYGICCGTPADWGFDFEDVRFEGAGETLAGWYLPSRNRAAVILLHGGGYHRLGQEKNARALASEGFGVLMYDRRAHGESTGGVDTFGWLDVGDVPGARRWLASRPEVDPGKIGIYGFSLGGQVALRAAAEDPELTAVMADGPSVAGFGDVPWSLHSPSPLSKLHLGLELLMRSWHTGVPIPPPVVAVIGEISPRPVCLVAAGAVEERLVDHYFEHARDPKTLWKIPETGHGGGWAARPEEYRERLVSFFADALDAERRAGRTRE